MKKRLIALVTAVCLAVTPMSVLAEETDYSYLEDMSVKELKALREAINNLLGDEEIQTSKKEGVIEGTYYRNSHPGDDYYEYTFIPDNSEKTYGTFSEGTGANGEYRIVGKTLRTEGTLIDKVFDITDNYLIAQEDTYEGTIPDEERFDAEVVQYYNSNNGLIILYTEILFASDGTYSKMTDYSDVTTKNKITNTSGTYEREGDFIILTEKESNRSTKYLVYNGQLNDYYIELN